MGLSVKLKMYLMLQLLFVFLLAGCRTEADTYKSQYKSREAAFDIPSSDGIQCEETRLLPEASAEGGEIVRYTGEDGRILRYRITYYGETGKLVENYYLAGDFIYYTSLLESYVNPISQGEVKTLSLVSAEGVISDGICYEYNSSSHTIGTNKIKTSYTNLQQLNNLFEDAGPFVSDSGSDGCGVDKAQ